MPSRMMTLSGLSTLVDLASSYMFSLRTFSLQIYEFMFMYVHSFCVKLRCVQQQRLYFTNNQLTLI